MSVGPGHVLRQQVRIVLVQPQHPGNVGSTARAMKNLGLRQLVVVSPASFDVERARWMASGAHDVLTRARFVATVDEAGLDDRDRKLLSHLAVTVAGRPTGLGTLADAVGESPDTIEDVYEPFLLQQGLLARTPRGRIATARAYVHLGLDVPREVRAHDGGQDPLFDEPGPGAAWGTLP